MTREPFEAMWKSFTDRRPFHPFTIKLAGGRRPEVDQAMALAYRSGTAVFLPPGNVPVIFDHGAVNVIVADASA